MEYKTSEAKREYMRRYKEMNREEINARRRASVKEKEAKQKWYQEHKEQIKERGREKTPMPMRRQIHHTHQISTRTNQ